MRTLSKPVALLTGLLILFTAILALGKPHYTSSADILAVEKNRTNALEHSDFDTLDKLLADDLTYVHASGKVDTKASYRGALRTGDLRYLSWEPKDLQVRVLGDSAVLTGGYHVRAVDQRMQAEPLDVHVIVLSVYAKRAGHWQQVAWQSTREPATK